MTMRTLLCCALVAQAVCWANPLSDTGNSNVPNLIARQVAAVANPATPKAPIAPVAGAAAAINTKAVTPAPVPAAPAAPAAAAPVAPNPAGAAATATTPAAAVAAVAATTTAAAAETAAAKEDAKAADNDAPKEKPKDPEETNTTLMAVGGPDPNAVLDYEECVAFQKQCQETCGDIIKYVTCDRGGQCMCRKDNSPGLTDSHKGHGWQRLNYLDARYRTNVYWSRLKTALFNNERIVENDVSHVLTFHVAELLLLLLYAVLFVANTFSPACMDGSQPYELWRIIVDAVLSLTLVAFYIFRALYAGLPIARQYAVFVVVTVVGSYAGLVLYYAVPSMRKMYMAVNALTSAAQMAAIATQATAVHHRADNVSALLHILMHVVYSSLEPNFHFFDAMYYVCLCLINGPTTDVIADTEVTRVVVVLIIATVLTIIPAEFSKMVDAFKRNPQRRPKIYPPGRFTNALIIMGHLTTNNIIPLLCDSERLVKTARNTDVFLVDGTGYQQELANAVKQCVFNHGVAVRYSTSLELEHVKAIATCNYQARIIALADMDSIADPQSVDQRCIAEVMKVQQSFARYSVYPTIHIQLLLEDSVPLTYGIPNCEVTCCDYYLVNLLAKSTAAMGISSILTAYALSVNYGCPDDDTILPGKPLLEPSGVPQMLERLYPFRHFIGFGNEHVLQPEFYHTVPFGAGQVRQRRPAVISARSLCHQHQLAAAGTLPFFVTEPVERSSMAWSTSQIACIQIGRQEAPIIYSGPFVTRPLPRNCSEVGSPSGCQPRWFRPSQNHRLGLHYLVTENADDTLQLRNHIVVCDYQQQVSRLLIPLIEHLKDAHNDPRLPVVILTSQPLDSADKSRLTNYREVYVLSGNPADINILTKANIEQAKAAVVLHQLPSISASENPSNPFLGQAHLVQTLEYNIRCLHPMLPVIRRLPSDSLSQQTLSNSRKATILTDFTYDIMKPFWSGEGCVVPWSLSPHRISHTGRAHCFGFDDLLLFDGSAVLHPYFRAQMLKDNAAAEYLSSQITFHELGVQLRQLRVCAFALSRLHDIDMPEQGRYTLYFPSNESLHSTDHVISLIPRDIDPISIIITLPNTTPDIDKAPSEDESGTALLTIGACWVAVTAQRVPVEAPVMVAKPAYTAPDPTIHAIPSGLDEGIDMSKYVDPNDPTKTIMSIDEIMGIGGSKSPIPNTSDSDCSKDYIACRETCNGPVMMSTCEALAKECKCQDIDTAASANQSSVSQSSMVSSSTKPTLSEDVSPDTDDKLDESDDNSGASGFLGVHSISMVGTIAVVSAAVIQAI
ncbi:hypothetical protein H4R35_002882 [Dimargaris xerosporica]|nr:hypothetical protein H4R35_002882 [Dimargaris xerosporica]